MVSHIRSLGPLSSSGEPIDGDEQLFCMCLYCLTFMETLSQSTIQSYVIEAANSSGSGRREPRGCFEHSHAESIFDIDESNERERLQSESEDSEDECAMYLSGDKEERNERLKRYNKSLTKVQNAVNSLVANFCCD